MHRLLSGIAIVLVSACGYEGDVAPVRGASVGSALDAVAEVGAAAVELATAAQLARGEVVPGSYIVAFRADTPVSSGGVGQRSRSFLTESRAATAPLVARYLADARVESIRYIDRVDLRAATPAAARQEPDPLPLPPTLQLAFDGGDLSPVVATLTEVQFAGPEAAATVLGEWAAGGGVWFAEPNGLSSLSSDFQQYRDTYQAGNLYWHRNINLYAAFDALNTRADGGTAVTQPIVAVLDSGVDVTHPALAGRIYDNQGHESDDCPGDRYGCDVTRADHDHIGRGGATPYGVKADGTCPTVQEDDDVAHNCQHGTHVAGIIAANWSQRFGGVCPVCRILPIKVIAEKDGHGSASDAAILNALKYITRFVASGGESAAVRVVNSSFGTYSRSRAVNVMVDVLARRPHEILVVGAAGNEESMQRSYPASFGNAIAVAALDAINRKAGYSNFGPWVDVAAPGGVGGNEGSAITSTAPGGGVAYLSGTSMACPVVAGVAGLALALDPTRGHAALRSGILRGADPRIYSDQPAAAVNGYFLQKPKGDTHRYPLLGSGIVDALCAVKGDCDTGMRTIDLNRVRPGCSVVAAAGRGRSGGWLLALASLPALAVALRRRTQGARAR
jgi:subtilisin family serine protease